MQIFGITLDDVSCKELLTCCETWFVGNDFHRITTVNSEFLLRAREDVVFACNLRSADLRVADGFGIVLVSWLRGKRIHRCPGADLMESLLTQAEQEHRLVFFAVRQDGLSSYEEIIQALRKKYPALIVDGSVVDRHDQASAWNDAHSKIRTSHATIVFSNFGAPEQEYFIESLREDPGGVRLAMGVGGSFDYLTGKIVRAPHCLRAVGLEWLWRLIRQPKRFGRIWSATVVFLFRSSLDK
ncbi:MAG: WecB/TagA/CpsF family glycosyltransferase [Candidatus Moranbacteria bacterium]|nr:WecB/TagA/CpsF family glycosyltransferase [Candidatus Moranbacteria bacterium]